MSVNISHRIVSSNYTKHVSSAQKKRPKLSIYVAVFIILLIILPSVQALLAYRLFRWLVLFFGLWILLINAERRYVWSQVFHPRLPELLIFCFWCCIVFLYPFIDLSNLYLNETMGNFTKLLYKLSQIIMCYTIGMVYATERDKKSFNWLVNIIFIALGVNALLAFPSLISPDILVREYINSYQSVEGVRPSLSIFALGGLGLYGSMAMLIPTFITITLQAKRLKKLIYVVLLLAIFANVYLSSILVAFLVLFVGVASFIFTISINRNAPRFTRLGVILFVGVMIIVAVQLKEKQAAQYSLARIEAYFSRSYDPSRTSPYRVKGDTTEKRLNLYNDSIQTFLDNPILGAGARSLFERYSNSDEIGGHSGVLDGFAMYGLLFSIFPIFLLLKYHHFRKMLHKNQYSLWVISSYCLFVAYCILIALDPLIFNATTSGLFFFLFVAPSYPSHSLSINEN